MFQFTTTTVINTNVDYSTGLELWSAQKADSDKPASLNIKRQLNFKQPNVVSITKAEYTEPKIAEAKLDLTKAGVDTTEGGLFRIAMYIKLASTSANSYYANDLVFKGKPLYIEFVWKKNEAASDVAKRIKELAKKYMLAVYEKDLIKVTATGNVVRILGIDEYQRFTKVDLEQYVEGEYDGHFEVIKSALPTTMRKDPNYDEDFKIKQGEEGFGTYQYIVKNLRLPTAARTAWTAINADEAPIIGAKYNEYIIRYCVNRGIMGGDAVGEVTKSLTTHVFYVNQDVADKFEEALIEILPDSQTDLEEVPAQD